MFELQQKDRANHYDVKPVINVVDAPCGAGKTSGAIQMMDSPENQHKKYIFVTPYLDEVDRIVGDSQRDFIQPIGTKTSHTKIGALKDLIEEGKNVVCTHSLYRRLDAEAKTLIRLGGYTLVLDEVFNVLDAVSLSHQERDHLLNCGILKREGEYIRRGDVENTLVRYDDIVALAEAGRLISTNGTIILWQFPVDSFTCFEEVWLLTFLYPGQLQKYFYDIHGFTSEMYTIAQTTEGSNRRYTFVPNQFAFLEDPATIKFITNLREKVKVYAGRSNMIGEDDNALSVSWYQKHPRLLPKLKASTGSVKKMFNAKAGDSLFTCFKDYANKVAPPGLKNAWIAHSQRATNKYRDRSALFYLVNRFMKPPVVQYLKHKKIKPDQGLFALSELIQWVCRSRIRDNEPVYLFLPSARMRHILDEFVMEH